MEARWVYLVPCLWAERCFSHATSPPSSYWFQSTLSVNHADFIYLCIYLFAILFNRSFLIPWFLFIHNFPHSKFLIEHDPSQPFDFSINTFLEFLLNYVRKYVLSGLGQWACPGVRSVEPNSNRCGCVRAALSTGALGWLCITKAVQVSDDTFDVFMIEIIKHPLPHQLKLGFSTWKTTRRGSVWNRDVPSLDERVLFLGISYILSNYIITIPKAMI